MGRFILADLRRLWAGALVMVLLIALAVALGVGVTLQERALRLGSARASEKFDLLIGAPGSEAQLVLSTVFLQPAALPLLPGDVLAALQDDPRVAWAAPVGFGDHHQGLPLIGTSTRLIRETAPGMAEGRIFAAAGEAVIGANVALSMGARITPSHGAAGHGGQPHAEAEYRVTGRMQPTGTPWDRAILVPIGSVWGMHGMSGDHDHPAGFDPRAPLAEDWRKGQTPDLPAIIVAPASIADAYKLRQDYRARADTLGVFPAEVLTGLYDLLGDARRVLAAVAIGAQVLVAAALLMVTLIHIGQRKRQIGALRAFGAPRGAVFALVWGEMLALAALGIGLGLAGGWLATRLLSRQIARMQGFDLPIEFTAGDFRGVVLLLAAAACLAALPAGIAYRQPPVASLRG